MCSGRFCSPAGHCRRSGQLPRKRRSGGTRLRRGAFHAPQAPLLYVQKRRENTQGAAPLDPAIANACDNRLYPLWRSLAFVGFRMDSLLAPLRRSLRWGFRDRFAERLLWRTTTDAAAAERKEEQTKSTEEKTDISLLKSSFTLAASGVKGQRPLRSLGFPKGASLRKRYPLWDMLHKVRQGCLPSYGKKRAWLPGSSAERYKRRKHNGLFCSAL